MTQRAGVILTNNKDEILLVFGKKAGKWSIPKGHVDENEDVFDAAHRELHEETGVVITEGDEHLGTLVISGIVFYVYTTDREISVEDAKIDDVEVTHAEWIPQSRINELDANRSLMNYFTYHYQTRAEREAEKQAKLERKEARKTVIKVDDEGFVMKTKKVRRASNRVEAVVAKAVPIAVQNGFGLLNEDDV